jgi:glycogen debranching enzyme
MPHELRVGEWAHFGLVPHGHYYGTADATPLYLLLLAEKQAAAPRFSPD